MKTNEIKMNIMELNKVVDKQTYNETLRTGGR